MNLFNYLMAKKGHNTSVRDDLLAYLLGKRTPKEVKTATGTTISITDATREKIVSLTLDKESTQDGTPTPENPVEVKTVKGYRNLFDGEIELGSINPANGTTSASTTRTRSVNFIKVKPNTTYYYSRQSGGIRWIVGYKNDKTGITDGNYAGYASAIINYNFDNLGGTFTTTSTTEYIKWYDTYDTDITEKVQITESSAQLPYVPYGTNYVAITNTNGTDTNYYTISLNDNEIAGIGDYKDELIVDKNGKCWLNKKTGKVVLNGSEDENWSNTGYAFQTENYKSAINLGLSNYFIYSTTWVSSDILYRGKFNFTSSRLRFMHNDANITTIAQWKSWLSTHNTEVYYVLATENLIDLNYTVDLTLFEGVNNISNSEDMDMTLKYY